MMISRQYYKPLMALLSGAAVLVLLGLDGLVQTALAVLTCEYAVCVAKTLRTDNDSGGGVANSLFALLNNGGIFILLVLAALLDSLAGAAVFRVAVCLAYIASCLPSAYIAANWHCAPAHRHFLNR